MSNELTDEQIAKLAPDWATHYKFRGKILIFESPRKYQFYNDGSFGGVYMFHYGSKKMTGKPIPRKKFDIIEEWEGLFGFESAPFIDDEGDIFVEGGWMCEEKAILLAKHFNLTADDLK